MAAGFAGAIFDVDGVLVDSPHEQAWRDSLAQLMEQRFPDLVVSRMAKELRHGKVLVDWSQNDEHKTTATVYSLRARERPTASTPVSWDEVSDCHEHGDEGLLTFEADELLARADDQGDLFAAALGVHQDLPTLR